MKWLSRLNGRKIWGIPVPSCEKGSFGHNQLMTVSQRGVAVLAQLIFTPIITRLYLPDAYGTMSAVVGITSLTLPFFTLLYDRAILLAREEKDIQALRALLNVVPTVLSVVLFVVLLIGGDPLLTAAGLPALGHYALFIPLLLVLTNWSMTGHQVVAARLRYAESFIYRSISTVGSKVTAVLHGWLVGGSALGLISAEIVLRLSELTFNSRVILRDNPLKLALKAKYRDMVGVMKKYGAFPKFELPAVILARVSGRIPLWWIPPTYGMAAFGHYGLGLSLLEMPLGLLSHSMSQTFYQKAAQVFHDEGPKRLRSITFRTMAFISIGSIIPMLLIGLFAEVLFEFLFGNEWGMAGRMAQALTVMYFAKLTVEPVTSVLRVIGKQHSYVWFNVLLLVLRLGAVGIALYLGLAIIPALFLYAAAEAFGQSVLTFSVITYLNRLVAAR